MTSKNLFSKLMKEDIKSRLWALALICLGCFFMFPVVSAFLAGEIDGYATYEAGLKYYRKEILSWLSFKNGLTSVVMMVTAVICGLSGFSYLNSRSKVDFYHSIPVKREKLYLVNYIDGILIWVIPYGVCLAVGTVIAVMNGVNGTELWPIVVKGYVLNVIYYLLTYSVVVIAAMLTGNVVIGFLGSLVFAFLIPILSALLQGYFGTFFVTYYQNDNSLFEKLYHVSPVMEYIYQYSRYVEEKLVWTAAMIALVLAVIFMVIGGVLYKKRPSEAAGKAMAFPISKPMVRIPIVITSALGLGLFFWEMRSSTGWAVFGVIFGALISHCVIEVIYHFDFRSLFSCKGQLAVCIAASLAVLLGFRYDVTGYDRYLPDASKVAYAAVNMNAISSWATFNDTEEKTDGSYVLNYQNDTEYMVSNMQYTDIENLLKIVSVGIENGQKNRDERMNPRRNTNEAVVEVVHHDGPTATFMAARLTTEEVDFNSYFTVCYTMNSGKKVYRRYLGNLESVKTQIDKMIQDEQYLTGAFPLMKRNADEIETIRFREQQEDVVLSDLTEQDKQELLDAYREEFSGLTIDHMKEEYPVGLIRFTKEIDERAMQWQNKLDAERSWSNYEYYRGYDFKVNDFYPVYPSFAKTLRILKEHGIEVGRYIEEMDIQKMTILRYVEGKAEDIFVVISDPEEIAQLKPLMLLEQRKYYNHVFQEDQIYGEITMEEEHGMSIERVRFPRGKVPEFVVERLEAEL